MQKPNMLIRIDHYFLPEGRGIMIGKKIVCMRKIDEIYRLPQRCISKNRLERLPLSCEAWGIRKKFLRSKWRKKIESI